MCQCCLSMCTPGWAATAPRLGSIFALRLEWALGAGTGQAARADTSEPIGDNREPSCAPECSDAWVCCRSLITAATPRKAGLLLAPGTQERGPCPQPRLGLLEPCLGGWDSRLLSASAGSVEGGTPSGRALPQGPFLPTHPCLTELPSDWRATWPSPIMVDSGGLPGWAPGTVYCLPMPSLRVGRLQWRHGARGQSGRGSWPDSGSCQAEQG